MSNFDTIKQLLVLMESIESTEQTEDVLVEPEEVLIDGDDDEVLEDYEGEAPYGETKEEVINNLLSKYFAIGEEFDGEDVTVHQEAIRTALSDAFEAGADKSVAKASEPVESGAITESVDSIKREVGNGVIRYDIDSETGVITIAVEVNGVVGSVDLVSDAIYRKMSDIMTNPSYTSEVAIEKLNVMRSRITSIIQSLVESQTFKNHVNDQLKSILEAYAGSIEELINREISGE